MGYEAYLLKCLRMKKNIHVKNATQRRVGEKMGSVWSRGLELRLESGAGILYDPDLINEPL